MEATLHVPTSEPGREPILEAGARIFRLKGYSATSLDDIANELGATKGRIYHYFRSKFDLLIAIHWSSLHLMMDGVMRAKLEHTSEIEQLEAMTRAHLRPVMDHRMIVAIAAREEIQREPVTPSQLQALDDIYALRDAFEAQFRDVIRRGMDRHVFREMDERIATKAFLGAINWMTIWYRPELGDEQARQHVEDEFVQFVMAGVLIPRDTTSRPR